MFMSTSDFETFNLAVSLHCLDFLAEEGVAVLFSPICLIACEKQHKVRKIIKWMNHIFFIITAVVDVLPQSSILLNNIKMD